MSVVSISAVTALSSQALEPINNTFQVSSSHAFPLSVEQGEYIRGSLNSDLALDSARLVDSKGKVVKSFLDTSGKEGELFWLVSTSGQYQIELHAKAGTEAKVAVSLSAKALKKDQSVNPQGEMLSPTLKRLAQALVMNDTTAEHKFWQQVEKTGTPLIEPNSDGSAILSFLWKGEVDNVRVFGAPYDGHANLSRIPNSQVWYKSYAIPDGSRFSYSLAPNIPQLAEDDWREQRRAVLATAAADPLNRRPTFGDDPRFGASSTVEYGNVPSDKYTLDLGHPQGRVTHHTVQSRVLGNERKVSVYLPNERYSLDRSAPLLVVFDGQQYLDKVPTPTILDNLIAAGKIPAMRAIFVNHPQQSLRGIELPPNPDFAQFMATELMTWARNTLSIEPVAKETILTGSSYGGLASMYIAHQHPDVFGKVLSQSGSFWWGPDKESPEWLTRQIEKAPTKPLDIYLNAGVFEVLPKNYNIISTNRTLAKVLTNKNYMVKFEELASGHDYYNWRVTIADGLIHLFSPR